MQTLWLPFSLRTYWRFCPSLALLQCQGSTFSAMSLGSSFVSPPRQESVCLAKEREEAVLVPTELIIYFEVRKKEKTHGRQFSKQRQESVPTNDTEAGSEESSDLRWCSRKGSHVFTEHLLEAPKWSHLILVTVLCARLCHPGFIEEETGAQND